MNKNILWLLGILVSLSAGFTSCSEDTQTVDPYSDWAVRNDAYIDSIASRLRESSCRRTLGKSIEL